MLEATTADVVSSCAPYKSCTLDSGVQVAWYQYLKDVPKGVGTVGLLPLSVLVILLLLDLH